MPLVKDSLWQLARGGHLIDARALASALEAQAGEFQPDFRTRLLIRDSLTALASYWGRERFDKWLAASASRDSLLKYQNADLGPEGFPTIALRIMDATKPEAVLEFLRTLGAGVVRPARLDIGGSTSLILLGDLSRQTDDIDAVDEVPAVLRTEHDLLDRLARRFGLRLTHFQSHYLPVGWKDRVHSLGRFGQLDVYLVDVYDVLVSKLFSAREKDLDDLRAMAPRIDKRVLESRVQQYAGPLLAERRYAQSAKQNWYVVYGEALPGA
jgi:hypothetical protein